MSRLVLASASPRRLELLRRCGIEPEAVVDAAVDESVLAGELPRGYAARVALAKAEAGAGREDAADAYVLAADTVVACGRRILGKAVDEAHAGACLDLLSGRRHRVLTAVVVATPERRLVQRLVETAVVMKRLTAQERRRYLDSGEWQGKAGGYAIQGLAEAFIPAVHGSYSNVVGLPLYETLSLLEGLGWRRTAGLSA